ncbi:Hsp20/alpha crystallin family protein [Desulfopila sp. IMCC35008]|uniref:Hsp20/alpha crystallin family protein n=1 Tax=Desulfopila sp. IMCC35008 TaxID=2653858 RepID=UPI0013D438E7|nr:Hsp20/alpha crystallin family protein [Desulfopila sp. IMCC35008]
MHMVHYNPRRNKMQCKENNIDKLFDGFFNDFSAPFFGHNMMTEKDTANGLQVDIYEKDNIIVVDADMPGITKEDIKLDVKGKLVTLGYERKDENEVKDEHLYRKEKRYGKFERTFSMPFEIDADKVTAKYDNGVLKLEIEKPEKQQKKQIEIS